ncbi:helix-turn-helix domain-containing protein [Methylobacterium sp. JK268]
MVSVEFRLDPTAPPCPSPAEETALDALTDAAITAAAEADPDNPPLTEAEIARGLFARDVRRTRKGLALTQEGFAAALGIPLGTVRNWEQGRVQPDPALRALIRLVHDDPRRAVRVLATAS